ncbi:MAG: SPOR domain-containing protein [Prevotellaceae bacterium]|nr:SPOR domain-containing protein [Prevotellaceae bacterium]
MRNFDELLCTLIQNNRRVIIPDIGAFITNSPDENMVFSPLLKHNDGFLEDKLQKEGFDNPAVVLQELAENIISVVERGQRYHIAGAGYFFKEEGIRFAFENTEKDEVRELSENTGYSRNNGNKSKLWIITALLCICMIVVIYLLLRIFNIYNTKTMSDKFTFPTEKPAHQFAIVDKSGVCDEITALQVFPQAKSYHVVAACFEEKDNAEKFVLQCKKNGYNRAEILSLTNVLYPVSIGAFASQDEALSKKQEYDERFGENSMILRTNNIIE